MPNEYAARYLSAGGRNMRAPPRFVLSDFPMRLKMQQGMLDVPGTEILPTFRGRTLYYPLYARRTFSGYRRGRGFGQIGEMLGVAASFVGQAAGFIAEIAKEIVGTILMIIKEVVSFIIDVVMKIVNAVLGAVSGLLGAVLDSIGLMMDGDMSPEKAAELAVLLTAKHGSLSGQENGLNRPMTGEEKDGYNRNLDDAKNGIKKLGGVESFVESIGGTTGTLAIAAGAAAAIWLAKK